jgi:hypothetical protein
MYEAIKSWEQVDCRTCKRHPVIVVTNH